MLLRFFLILLTQNLLAATPSADSVLLRVGASFTSLQIDGKLSTRGKQSLNGMPFSVVMDSTQTYELTMVGPFGFTAARMFATADSFVMINYLQQEVWDGNPHSPNLAAASHMPLPATDLMQLLRGRIPGDADRFQRSPAERTDSAVLFMARDSVSVEYLLVDTAQNVLRQYQRKDTAGSLLLDVAFQDLRTIDGHVIPHKVVIAANDRAETATVDIVDVEVNALIETITPPPIPRGFSRRTFR